MGPTRAVWVSVAEMVEMEMSLVEGTLLVGQATEEKTTTDTYHKYNITAISRKVVTKSACASPGRYCG